MQVMLTLMLSEWLTPHQKQVIYRHIEKEKTVICMMGVMILCSDATQEGLQDRYIQVIIQVTTALQVTIKIA